MAIKVEDFIKELKEMKVQDLNELVKAIEEEFGVTAAAPVAAAGAADGADAGSAEKNLVLTAVGGNTIAVIKLVKEILGLGLMEAKQATVDGTVLKENVSAEEAEEIIAKFKEAGATVEAK
jgi:large subunit ribosomal protein L7/L12